MIDLEQYKDAFGVAGLKTGWRKYRILGISIFDVVVVLICCVPIAWLTGVDYWKTLVIVFILGIIIHRAFAVRTTIDKTLFPNAS